MLESRSTRPIRIAKLVRVSTTHLEQADSPQHQLSYIESECRREACIDTGLVYRAELTGAIIVNRPDIQRMLEDAKAGLFDAIVLKSISRLGRDTLGLLLVKRMLDDVRVELIALADGYRSFRDPELIFLVHAERAQAGRQEISKNVKAGIVQVAKRGIWPAGTLPFGLRKVNRFDIDLDPETAPVAQLIFELRKQHFGTVAICKHLNQELRVKAPEWWHLRERLSQLESSDEQKRDDRLQERIRRLRERLTTGRFLWHPKTVRIMLENTAYYGELYYNRTTGERRIHGQLVRKARDGSDWVTIPCTPLVSKEDWELAQAVGETRNRFPRKSLGSAFVLSGMIHCGVCGYSMRAQSVRPGAGKRGGERKGYYVCRGAIEAGAHKSEYIRATELEAAVLERLRAELTPIAAPEPKLVRRPAIKTDPAREATSLEAHLRDLAEARFFRREELRKGKMSQAEFDYEEGVIRKKEEHLRQQLEQLKQGRVQAREDELRLRALQEAARKLARLEGPVEAIQALLRTLVTEVIVHSSTQVEVHTTFTQDEAYNTASD